MRRLSAALLATLALFVSCTQDFDKFSIGDTGGAAGSAGATGGTGGGGTSGAGGSEDASLDADADAAADGDAQVDGGCPAGTKDCGGSCVPDDDPATGCAGAACSPCSFANATAACDASGQCAIDQCSTGYSDCNGNPGDGCEAQPDTDPQNCGACGTVCVVPNATAGCVGGQCTVGSCNAGYTDCDQGAVNGCEVNTDSDPEACGSCTNDCTAQAGTWTCNNGTCVVSQCPAGKGECDGNPGTVCETDTNTSTAHCGFCNNPCNLPNATSQCSAGACSIASCDPGFEDCDNVAANGCEVDLSKDTKHCGACNRQCSTVNTGTVACSGGVCTSSCSPGFGNCVQPAAPAADEGCESNLLTDTGDCGACGRTCSTANVTGPACSDGKCTSSCVTGWANCAQPLAPAADDGCEINISTNTSHCGGCGRACSTVNVASAVCSAGLCTSSCNPGYGNCTTPAAPAADNGCETATGTDVNNCGACNRACASNNVAVKTCTAGLCNSTCSGGYSNCSTPAAPTADNGCETDTLADPANCGACGRPCSTANVQLAQCSSGLCTSTCVAGYGNCTTPGAPTADNGCETSTGTDPANCGACGRACSTTGTAALACAGGLCTSTCNANLGNCTQPVAPSADDGCETNTATNTLHCGACGHDCKATNVVTKSCSAGKCNSFCALGYANCNQPSPPTVDDGCELDASDTDTQCGSCTNNCASQNGQVCGDGSIPDNRCGCASSSDCSVNGSSASCNSSGLCVCPVNETCGPGEVCVDFGATTDCSCNGGPDCSGSQVCCQNPAGCFDLSTSPTSCGACGRACPSGFVCSSGNCVCSGDPSCNAGTSGTCSGGVCTCPSGPCPAGQRCQPNGACG